MKRLFEKLVATYNGYPVCYRFYVASLLVYLAGFVFYYSAGTPSLIAVTTVASVLIICGFVVWCFPVVRWLHGVWDRPFGKTPIVLLHLVALLVATACGRYAVSEALGLPPQSFDLTVGFLTLVFYIPSLLGVIAVFLLFAALVFLPIALLGFMFNTVRQHIISFLSIFGFKAEDRPGNEILFFHIAGALISSVLLASGYTYLTSNLSPGFKVMTRFIAVRSDFHKARHYPGSKVDEYVHPLENGFIAYARQEEGKHIVIGVRLQLADPLDVQIERVSSIKQMISKAMEDSATNKE